MAFRTALPRIGLAAVMHTLVEVESTADPNDLFTQYRYRCSCGKVGEWQRGATFYSSGAARDHALGAFVEHKYPSHVVSAAK